MGKDAGGNDYGSAFFVIRQIKSNLGNVMSCKWIRGFWKL